MDRPVAEWGALATAAVAVLGWIQALARLGPRVSRAERDIQALAAKVDNMAQKADVTDSAHGLSRQIAKITDRLEAMDSKRESARGDIGEFRERISRELGEIRAALYGPSFRIKPKGEDPRD